MKQFFKYVLATLVGMLAFGILLFLIFGVVMVGSVKKSFESEKVKVKANSILHVQLGTPVGDRPTNEPIGPAFFGADIKANDGLKAVTDALETAKEDTDIKGVYLNLNIVPTGYANLDVIMNSVNEFKESGKFVVAYGNYYTQKAYGLASTADEIYVHPEGGLDFKGINAELMFYKGAMEKLGIEENIFYAGKFKSATEPYRRKNMSEANRQQVQEFIGDIYEKFVNSVAKNRGMDAVELRAIADEYKVRKPEDGVTHKLIDGIKYHDEVMTILREKVNFEEDEDLNFIELGDYVESKGLNEKKSAFGSGNKIAIVYAEGGIGMGGNDNSGISGEQYRKILSKLRKDDKVKAVVLRVNSPGGSVFDSDVIYRELELLKKEKTLVTTMGNVAASGGYYIACNSEKIFAEENTITGSIGVFATLFNMENFMNNKLGITTDRVMTGKFSDFPNVSRTWSAEENEVMQSFVDDIYDDFLQKVADGREMNVEQVHEIAQGRVWSGTDALELGLVDEIGGLEDAIAYAKEKAELDKYKLITYPEQKSGFEQFMEIFDAEAKAENAIKSELGDAYQYLELIREVQKMEGPQMRLPFEMEIN